MVLLLLLASAVLGIIPANIAKEKGYDAGLWWLYGTLLFLMAIIHASCLPDKNQKNKSSVPYYSPSDE